jgi:sugar/nucleoside kinase (ribokinase family)
MGEKRFDVLGIGNAIVDVLAHADETEIARLGLNKNAMTLIDAQRAETLYGEMGPGVEISGGSCANTMVGLASFGGKAAYVGKVRDDQLGRVFSHDIRAAGVHFESAPTTAGASTARCLIFVTPDALRTMNTYLGACIELGPEDIDEALVASASVIYLEGYLWDPPRAKEAFIKAAEIAHRHGNKVALTLSDAFCVERHRATFRELVEHHIDILFANEAELKSLYEARWYDDALQALRWQVEVAALTRGPHGSIVLDRDEVHVVEAFPIDRLVDTTGAGDLFASGFLYGFTQGLPPATCGRLGSLAAAEAIQHFGARPERPLAELARELLA